MTLASLRDRFSAPLEWTAAQIAKRPKGALVLWAASILLTMYFSIRWF